MSHVSAHTRRRAVMVASSVAALALGLSAARPSPPRALPGYGYTVHLTVRASDGGAPGDSTPEGDSTAERALIARAVATAERARIDIVKSDLAGDRGAGPRLRAGAYLLVADGGERVTVVSPRDSTYTEVGADALAGTVGTLARAVRPLAQVSTRDVRISSDRLGPGEPAGGFETRGYRITEDYTIEVSVLGELVSSTQHHAVTEAWVAADLRTPRNPLFAFLDVLGSALAAGDADFVRQSALARTVLRTGTPVRTVTTVESTDAESGDVTRTTATLVLRDIRPIEVDTARFAVPAGYRARPDAIIVEW